MGRRLTTLTTTFTDGADLDPQSAVTVLGAMTGLGTQVALVTGERSEDPDYTSRTDFVVDSAKGARALMGDAIAFPLVDAQYSVWNIVTTPRLRTKHARLTRTRSRRLQQLEFTTASISVMSCPHARALRPSWQYRPLLHTTDQFGEYRCPH